MPVDPQDDLGVAVVGYGLGGSVFHAPLIAATAGLRLAAVVTGDSERSAAARTRYPGVDVVPDPESLWARKGDIDVVVLATPNRTHVPLAMAALEAGLHVVIDKPMATTAAEGRHLIEEARQRNLLLTVYQNRRWDGDFLTLRHLIERGELGTVHRFESRFERWRPAPKPGWRQSAGPEDGGGLLYDLGAHLIDQALVLFGPVRDVHAELDRRRPGARVDDDAFLALTHESGVRSHLWMNVITASPAPRFRVLGSKATWTKWGMDPQEEQLRHGSGLADPGYGHESDPGAATLSDGVTASPSPLLPGDYPDFYRQLARALREGGPPPVEPAEAAAVVGIIERARERAIGEPG